MTAYYLASDGLLYRNPLISGPGYHVVFDDYDEPELVLAVGTGPAALDATTARLRAVSILEQSGLSAVISGPPRLMARAFDLDGRDRRDAYCFWLSVNAPLPRAALDAECAGVLAPEGEANVFAFGAPHGSPAPEPAPV